MPDTTTRASAWSVTINNPIEADEENIALARQKGWKVEGQKEQGEQGTVHYQLLVKTPQIRFSALKKQFPRAHIEPARNVAALEQYVNKEDTRIGELKQDQEKYPSLQKLWDMFYDWIKEKRHDLSCETWGGEKWLRYFDWFINDAIIAGYVVETMGVNPQVRACVKQYGRSLIVRCRNAQRQADRQTAAKAFSVEEHNEDALSQGLSQEEGGEEADETDVSQTWSTRVEVNHHEHSGNS